MPAPGQFLEALLLRSVDYRDADRIVTLLTSAQGKVGLIARGARRSTKRFGGALSPFAVLRVEVRPGRGSLGVLAQAHVTRAFPRILSDLQRMGAGYAALEVLREVTREDEPLEAVFATAAAMLEALDAEGAEPEALLVCFQARLMALVGFAPGLESCGHCGKRPGDGQSALFDARSGHLVCRACGGASHKLSASARLLLARACVEDFRAVAAEPWPAADLAGARDAMRSFVEHRIGKPLTAGDLMPRDLTPQPPGRKSEPESS